MQVIEPYVKVWKYGMILTVYYVLQNADKKLSSVFKHVSKYLVLQSINESFAIVSFDFCVQGVKVMNILIFSSH